MTQVSKKISWEIVKKCILPLTVFLVFIGSYIFYKLNLAPTISMEAQQGFSKYIVTIFILCITFILHRITSAILSWYKANIAAKTISKLDDNLIPLIRRTLKVLIWIVAFLVILPFYGVNMSALIATLGVGSLAIALAAQDTIANIISGFLIMIDAPFRIGDRIKLPSGEVVEVLDIGVRRSKFLSEDKSIIIAPNLDLSKSKIINYTYGEERQRG
ncbi:MAG: mechanosensitive ion channel family protein [Candidatus Omnitrophica bacterium]|nr:mechanosensitive ion channel family protein [Candidatus Omnitrophota bacterium]